MHSTHGMHAACKEDHFSHLCSPGVLGCSAGSAAVLACSTSPGSASHM